jgi:hypothetical protein
MPLEILDPTGVDQPVETRLARRDGCLAGRRLGLLANGKTNASALLELVGELLTQRYGLSAPVLVDKRNASAPAADTVLDGLLHQCDVVVTAIGD